MSLVSLPQNTSRFETWLNGGGPVRVGLESTRTRELNVAFSGFVADARELGRELTTSLKIWRRMYGDGSVEHDVVRSELGLILVHLAEAREGLIETTKSAGRLSNAAVLAQESVKALMIEDEQALVKINEALISQKNSYDTQRKILEAARAELSGDKAVLNGFLSGLTLGIHNPVQQNMDKAKAAIHSINISINTCKAQHRERQQRIKELRDGEQAMTTLCHVPRAMVVVRNRLNTVTKAITPAYERLEKTSGKRDRVMKIYLKRAAEKMETLQATAANLKRVG